MIPQGALADPPTPNPIDKLRIFPPDSRFLTRSTRGYQKHSIQASPPIGNPMFTLQHPSHVMKPKIINVDPNQHAFVILL